MRLLLLLLGCLAPYFASAQADKLAAKIQLDHLPINSKEIRVYTFSSMDNYTELFRFYEENNEWHAEKYDAYNVFENKKSIVKLTTKNIVTNRRW